LTCVALGVALAPKGRAVLALDALPCRGRRCRLSEQAGTPRQVEGRHDDWRASTSVTLVVLLAIASDARLAVGKTQPSNGTTPTSGVYFIRLKIAGKSGVTRVVVLN